MPPTRSLVFLIMLSMIISPGFARAGELQAVATGECPSDDQVCGDAARVLATDHSAVVTVLTGGGDERKFQVALGTFIAAASSDVALSMYQIGRGSAREAGFGWWWPNDPVKLAVTKSVTTALFAYELQKIHKTRPKLAFALGIAATTIESSLAVRSARMAAREP
jgi:hypothetical protein